jgi:hypothetical protein
MPHKANTAHRHHILRPKRRVTNWAEYDAALRRRGNLTVWFTDDAIDAWRAEPQTAADPVDRFLGDGTYDRTGVYTGSV